jgi:hypothetical protein
MSSKSPDDVFAQWLSSKAMEVLAECMDISRDVEPAPEDMIRVEAVGSGVFIANIKRFEYMTLSDLKYQVSAIVGKPQQTIEFPEGHGGGKITKRICEYPKTTVFVMYYKMCSHCCVNAASVFGYSLGLMCSDCAARYQYTHHDYLEERSFMLDIMRPRVITRHAYLKTRQPTDYACIPHIVKPRIEQPSIEQPSIVQPSIEQLLFGEDYQKQRKRKRNNKWSQTGKSTIYSHKPNRMHR